MESNGSRMSLGVGALTDKEKIQISALLHSLHLKKKEKKRDEMENI